MKLDSYLEVSTSMRPLTRKMTLQHMKPKKSSMQEAKKIYIPFSRVSIALLAQRREGRMTLHIERFLSKRGLKDWPQKNP